MIWEVNGPKGILKVGVVTKSSKQTHGKRGVGMGRGGWRGRGPLQVQPNTSNITSSPPILQKDDDGDGEERVTHDDSFLG